ncbi:MAG: gliding motility lipoprotein GldH [Bacteroidota bacterium]|nr:gliding motility lipoprotein GldH [Bacteroidota bacterium]
MKYLLLLLPFLLTLPSCKRDVLVEEKYSFENNQWLTGDAKVLKINAPDTSQVFQLDVDLQHEATYAFQNLYVRVKTIYPSGKEVKSVTSLQLSNENGSWAGDCSGKNCSIELPLQHHFTFPEIGEYTWTIEPYMRIDTVQGIKSLTVRCRKVTQ